MLSKCTFTHKLTRAYIIWVLGVSECWSAFKVWKYVIWGSCSNEPCLLIRTCSSLGPVRRSRVSCRLKNQVEKPGRRFISSCAARDSTAPPRARPRSAGPAQSQTLVTVTTWPLVWVNRGLCVFSCRSLVTCSMWPIWTIWTSTPWWTAVNSMERRQTSPSASRWAFPSKAG